MPHEEDKTKTIKEKILEAIKEGSTTMRPRWHFILQSTLLLIGGVMLFLLLLYVTSFIVFTLHQTGAWFAPGFGGRGWFALVRSIPWALIFLSLCFIAVLEILVKHYVFAYRKPLLYSIGGILLIVIVGANIFAPWHRNIFREARENRLPIAGPFYRNFGMPHMRDVHRGQITQITENGFVMEDWRSATSAVVTTRDTRMILDMQLEPGDMVVVFGDESPEGIHAYGIQKISE